MRGFNKVPTLCFTAGVYADVVLSLCLMAFAPAASWQILCMYKTLLSDKTDLIFSYFDPTDVSVLTPLSLERFYGFYQVAKLKWIKVGD